MSYDDLLLLHNIDNVFDKYYNSGSFKKTLDFLFARYDNDYFKLFLDIAEYFDKNGLFSVSLSKYDLYDIMYGYCESMGLDCRNELKYDYIKSIRSHNLPVWCRYEYTKAFTDCCYAVLKDEEFKKKFLPHYYDIPANAVFKTVRFEAFSGHMLLFDFKTDAVIDVTEYFTANELEF